MPLQDAPYLRNTTYKTLANALYGPSDIQNYDWEPNIPFTATIEIAEYNGKSIVVIDSDTGTRYCIIPSYLLKLVHMDVIRDSKVTGTWHVVKHGTAFSIRLV
jgi:hypothetical protein